MYSPTVNVSFVDRGTSTSVVSFIDYQGNITSVDLSHASCSSSNIQISRFEGKSCISPFCTARNQDATTIRCTKLLLTIPYRRILDSGLQNVFGIPISERDDLMGDFSETIEDISCVADVEKYLLKGFHDKIYEARKRPEFNNNAVYMSIPVTYGYYQRKLVEKAAANSELKIIDFVFEPVAAGAQTRETYQKTAPYYTINRLAVYDLGGGTFDVSILDFSLRTPVVGVNGDPNLGGNVFDTIILERLRAKYPGSRKLNPAGKPGDKRYASRMSKLMEEIKLEKENLGVREGSLEEIPNRGADDEDEEEEAPVLLTFSKVEVYEWLQKPLERSIDILESTLKQFKMEPGDKGIEAIALIGGSSSFDIIPKMLEKRFPTIPVLVPSDMKPTQAVCFGLGTLYKNKMIKDYVVSRVLSQARIGILLDNQYPLWLLLENTPLEYAGGSSWQNYVPIECKDVHANEVVIQLIQKAFYEHEFHIFGEIRFSRPSDLSLYLLYLSFNSDGKLVVDVRPPGKDDVHLAGPKYFVSRA